jgi:hypothetical protein
MPSFDNPETTTQGMHLPPIVIRPESFVRAALTFTISRSEEQNKFAEYFFVKLNIPLRKSAVVSKVCLDSSSVRV